jgi:hypothetical protein
MNGHRWTIDEKSVVGNSFIRGVYKETMKELIIVILQFV